MSYRFPTSTTPIYDPRRFPVMRRPTIAVVDYDRLYRPGQKSIPRHALYLLKKAKEPIQEVPEEKSEQQKAKEFDAQGKAAEEA